jgi:hypothetical protein
VTGKCALKRVYVCVYLMEFIERERERERERGKREGEGRERERER